MDLPKVSSIRAVYALIALLLLVALVKQWQGLIVFISFMLLFGAVSGKCPSKWLLEKIGFKKTEL